MTWNTWWRFGGNWAEREAGIVRLVKEQAPDLLGIQECWAEGERTQADVIADAIDGHAAFVSTGLPPAPDPAEHAEHADGRTYSSTNRFASVDAADQYDRRIDHILFTPGYLGARAHDTWVVRDEPGGLPPSDHYPVVSEIGWSTSGA